MEFDGYLTELSLISLLTFLFSQHQNKKNLLSGWSIPQKNNLTNLKIPKKAVIVKVQLLLYRTKAFLSSESAPPP